MSSFKRKRSNNEPTTPEADSSSETLTYDAAQVLIRQLITQYNINPALLVDSEGPFDFSSLWNLVANNSI